MQSLTYYQANGTRAVGVMTLVRKGSNRSDMKSFTHYQANMTRVEMMSVS